VLSFRYKDRWTALHKLSPFCKLAWLVAIFIISLIFDHPLYLLLLFLSTVLLVLAAGVWREWLSFMKFALYLALAIVIINTLVSQQGSHILWQAGFRVPVVGAPLITLEAIVFSLGMVLRLLAIISAFVLFTFTVHPDDIMMAMIKLKLPYKSVMVTSLSTRFVPTLIDDAERIGAVQRSRGLELDRGKLLQRIRSRMAIIIPLLANSLDRTVQVAEAMDSRAFGSGNKRTFYRKLEMGKLDIPPLVASFLALSLGIFMRVEGWGIYQYYPVLAEVNLDGIEVIMLSLLLLILCLIVPLSFLKKRIELD
jgi:energy-coupling factor transport system permease protein